MTDIHSLAEWLADRNCSLPTVDHQDGVWVIASAFTHVDLLPLLSCADAIPARRDCITYALIVQLNCLIDTSESNEPYTDETSPQALDTLTQFARDNWDDVLRIDAEMGFGADFDTFVVPHIISA